MSFFKNPHDPVTDDEILYRRIRLAGPGVKSEQGELKISASAFNDSIKRQPSVDRASLQENGPESSKQASTDGVLSLNAGEIRAEPVAYNDFKFILDIHADPMETNKAHAIIVTSPEYRNEKDFRKAQERLARLATVVIPPA